MLNGYLALLAALLGRFVTPSPGSVASMRPGRRGTRTWHVVAFCLALAAGPATAGGVARGFIQLIMTNAAGVSPPSYDYVIVNICNTAYYYSSPTCSHFEPIAGTPACNLYHGFALRIDTPQGRALYRTLLTAADANRAVTLYGTGECLYFDRETVQAVMYPSD